jgi:ABC-type transport system involved in cytochrome c biogenesis permease subunit
MKFITLLFSLCLFFIQNAYAASLDINSFAKIPVQHEGRMKPLDSFARAHLNIFSGKENLDGQPAILWLGEALFDPITSVTRPVFRIDNPNLRHELGLEEREKPLYRFDELTLPLGQSIERLESVRNKDSKTLTQDEKDFLELHENALLYTQILRSFSLLLPLNIQLPPEWQNTLGRKNNGEALSYLELQRLEPDVDRAVKSIIARYGLDPRAYNDADRATVTLGWQLRNLREASSRNELLRIIPPQWQSDTTQNNEWFSPWSLLRDGQGSPQTARLMNEWKNLALAWQNQDHTAWEAISKDILITTLSLQGDKNLSTRLNIELSKNKINPISIALFGYVLALCLAILFFTTQKNTLLALSFSSLAASFIIHVFAIALRCYLLERPPVGTLYESIIFVAMCVAGIGLIYHYKNKDGLAFLTASLGASGLTLLASGFEGRGDDMTILSAVLNTRFWLATHVIIITLGYGWAVMAALWAQALLFLRACGRSVSVDHHETLHRLSLVALLLTSVGTILGGIWADQSWGRFWGWDPKENGALLIVVWIVWLLHGKLSGHIRDNALLVGYGVLTIIVAAAWIGVNLLGVGLHSYGFIDGLFWGLAGFTVAQLLLLFVLWWKAAQCAKISS